MLQVEARACMPCTGQPSAATIVDRTGRLKPVVQGFIKNWLAKHGGRPVRIMKEVGFKGGDYRLGAAVNGNAPLRSVVVDKLVPWLAKHGYK